MAVRPSVQQFVLLPPRGIGVAAAIPPVAKFFRTICKMGKFEICQTPRVQMRVLDSIRKDGPKLVELSPDNARALRAHQPGLRIVPVVYFRPAVAPRVAAEKSPGAAGRTAVKIQFKIVSKKDGSPVAGAMVVAFTHFTGRIGASGTSNSQGDVRLALGGASKKIERLYVYPAKNFWSAIRMNFTLTSGMEVGLAPVDLAAIDALRYFYGRSSETAGKGIKVAVIDTGIDRTHPDLKVQGGMNTVVGEDPADFGDNGEGHGTHVAGIIAARGTPPAGIRGIAPNASLLSYRVFGKKSGGATNYAIAKAIDRAVTDGCDLINMSLGGGDPDHATRAAIEDARARGTLVIVAAGNDGHAPVSFPASDSMSIAISAMGRKGTFPADATETGDVAPPYGKDKKNFVAGFSNIGPEIDLIGPGVGILSTVPGGYAPMSGTSMSCPAVTGLAARLLSARKDILGMKRNQARSDAMAHALLTSTVLLGFGAKYEGQGLPQTK